MTTRTAFLGLLATAAGLAVLALTGGVAPTVVGVVLLGFGSSILTATGLLGLRTRDAAKTATAVRAKDEGDSAAMKTASETGRWPRIIGGG